MNKKTDYKKIVVWLLTVILSAIYIFAGNRYMSRDLDIMGFSHATVKAVVTELSEYRKESVEAGVEYINYIQFFEAKLLSGEQKGEIIISRQDSDNYTIMNDRPVTPGDKIILYNLGEDDNPQWVFGSYARFDTMLVFAIIFFVLLIVFGRIKGLNTIISLAFTCLAIFMVFIPAVLKGENIYLWTCITCAFTIIMTLLLTNGATYKSLTTILGCSFGVAVAAGLTVFFDKIMHLTGILDEHSIYLQMLSSGVSIDLRGLIFAMVTIGAMGAVMDVAMDISSSLYEIRRHARTICFNELFKSGLRIGRDIMGTMANTLVLAYIGSSLCAVLLYITYSSSLLELLNRENIVVEIMNSLIGSTAILLTIPLTSIICGILYTDKDGSKHDFVPAENAEREDNCKDSGAYKVLEKGGRKKKRPGIFYYTGGGRQKKG